jgi:hypothetical protein
MNHETIGPLGLACVLGTLTACGAEPPDALRSGIDGPSLQAESTAAIPDRPRVDPRIPLALSCRRAGRPSALGRDARFAETGRLPVYVRFAQSQTPAVVAPALPGVEWQNSAMPIPSGAYLARVDDSGLAALEATPGVIRVESGLDVDQLHLAEAAEEVRIAPLRLKVLAVDGRRLDGTGRRIADIDSDAFVFHPGLFRADAGTYAWLDVDGDGIFVPGVDAIDLNGDGQAEPAERAEALLVRKVDKLFTPFAPHTDFRPDEDFLFLDSNANGKRDYGEGFAETTPAYGEPLFVVDDANEDGILEPSERVVRLGTSVFERIRDEHGAEFVRGSSEAGIIDYGNELVQDADRMSTAAHGTMMTGILAAGPFPSHRLAGMAPGADILLGAGKARAEGIAWALELAPDAISMPFGQDIFCPLDGSSELEMLVDSVMKAGSIPVTSAGNGATSAMHAATTLPVGSSSLSLSASYPSQALYLSILFRRPVDSLELSITLPDGTLVDIPATSTSVPVSVGGGISLGHIADVSSRGTHQRHIQLYAPAQFPIGKYTLNATLSDSKPLDVQMYASNDWRYGFSFDEHVTVSSTISSPGTADEALSVGGYALHHGTGYGLSEAEGALASFSARGPRIDGFHDLDLVAPVNPLSTAIDVKYPDDVSYEVWPGTSCAAPIVAGAIALLRQLYPDESAESIRQRIVSTARKDTFVSADQDKWGKGKLDVAAAAGIDPTTSAPPSVRLEVPPEIELGQKLNARVVVTDDGAAHRTRWDVGYDGIYDTDWLDADEHVIEPKSLGPLALRVETHDEDGNIAGATTIVNVVEGKPPEPAPSANPPSGSSSCSVGPRLPDRSSGLLALVGLIAALVGLGRRWSGRPSAKGSRRSRRAPARLAARPRGFRHGAYS